jgi:hypothetical protein
MQDRPRFEDRVRSASIFGVELANVGVIRAPRPQPSHHKVT